jgi:hypothetical protein
MYAKDGLNIGGNKHVLPDTISQREKIYKVDNTGSRSHYMKTVELLRTTYSALYFTITWFILISYACSPVPAATSTDTPIPTNAPTSTVTLTLTLIPSATSQPTPTWTPTLDETAIAALCAAVPDGLVGWWNGDGSAQDMVAGNDGSLNSGASFETGKVRQAFRFDGINDSVDIPRAANLNVGRQVSIEFWMRPAEDNKMSDCCQGLVGTDYYLIEFSGGWTGNIGVNFAVNTDGIFYHTSDKTDTGFKVSSGQWTFVVGTYDGNNLRLYINGKEEVQLNHQGSIQRMSSSSFLSIGSEDGRANCPDCLSTRYFKGLIDEVSIYKRALTEAEIQSIYSAGEAGKCSLQK